MSFTLLFASLFSLFGSTPSAAEVLAKCIQYHDPQAQWASGPIYLKIRSESPKGSSNLREAWIDIPGEKFEMQATRASAKSMRAMLKDSCYFSLNGQTELPEDSVKKYRFDCERTLMFRNYLTYLNGLPMKLTDPGTILDEKVGKEQYMGQEVLVLTVRYEPEVGDEIYQFYILPDTYAMIGYRFYRDEDSPKGEYIVLKEETMVGQMRIPKIREWYTFPDTSFLGTDILEEGRFE
ncbi:MAG: DUF6503 family protein [Bacteroidota bacterium]